MGKTLTGAPLSHTEHQGLVLCPSQTCKIPENKIQEKKLWNQLK